MIGARPVRAPRGTTLTARSWQTEAPLRMLMNNLDPEVAERPDDLVVYGGTGRAARSWDAFDAIVRSLRDLEHDETLVVQSGKPAARVRTHSHAPRVVISHATLVPKGAGWGGRRTAVPGAGVDRRRRQRGRGGARAPRSGVPSRHCHRPDLGPRPARRLHPGWPLARGGRAPPHRERKRLRTARVRFDGEALRGNRGFPGR